MPVKVNATTITDIENKHHSYIIAKHTTTAKHTSTNKRKFEI